MLAAVCAGYAVTLVVAVLGGNSSAPGCRYPARREEAGRGGSTARRDRPLGFGGGHPVVVPSATASDPAFTGSVPSSGSATGLPRPGRARMLRRPPPSHRPRTTALPRSPPRRMLRRPRRRTTALLRWSNPASRRGEHASARRNHGSAGARTRRRPVNDHPVQRGRHNRRKRKIRRRLPMRYLLPSLLLVALLAMLMLRGYVHSEILADHRVQPRRPPPRCPDRSSKAARS
ncbi:hypothetical protein NKH18_19670 [Streptomyces sp. M10(2022)]